MYMLQKKNACVKLLQHFFAYIENQFHTTVKIVRSDNAKDLYEGELIHRLYLTKGIIHKKSTTATPQQNGVVERKHKRLLEVAALFFQSKLPMKFWGDYVQTATYIINRPL